MRFPLSKLGSWNESEQRFSPVAQPCGHLLSLAVCEHRGIVVTCGVDNSVKVWEGLTSPDRLLTPAFSHVFDEVPPLTARGANNRP